MTQNVPPSWRDQKRANRRAILAETSRPLTEEELARLERKKRTLQNRRGRKQPAVVPTKLARTSAFAPRRKGLITDSNFVRVYEVPGYSVVEVKGRELGSQHRDALYALFRLKRTKVTMPNPDYRPGTFINPSVSSYQTETTWRELLQVMGRTEHVNNLLTLKTVLEEIQQVVITIHEGRSIDELEKIREGRRRNVLPNTAGHSSSLIKEVRWTGAQLDSPITVEYGSSMLTIVEKAHLVSINADVQFKLNSDYAKTFWPFIDSQPNFNYIDETKLAQLAGRDLWDDDVTSAHRAQFRKECRQAFQDMEQAGGLLTWSEEVTGSGQTKSRRYHFVHASPRQMELEFPLLAETHKS